MHVFPRAGLGWGQFSCTSALQTPALLRLVNGVCLSGAWGVFTELSQLSSESLAAWVEHLRHLQLRLRARERPTFRSLGMAAVAARHTTQAFGDLGREVASRLPTGGRRSSLVMDAMLKERVEEENYPKFAVFATFSRAEGRAGLPKHLQLAFRAVEVRKPRRAPLALWILNRFCFVAVRVYGMPSRW